MKTSDSRFLKISILSILIGFVFIQCTTDNEEELLPKDPDSAEIVSIDRFSDDAGNLMKRSSDTSLPAPNEPINFDEAPFITQSFGPDGNVVKYYNFDVQSLTPAPIYVFFREGSETPVENQLNIINTIPGDPAYNDFWQVYKITVPEDYTANQVTSFTEIQNEGFDIQSTPTIVNCPVVPEGSTAQLRYRDGDPVSPDRGWYQGKVVYYFTFEEKALEANEGGLVPVSPIYVTFNINPDPDNPGSGPASGFMTESGSSQTHNVVATIPEDNNYSPLWQVHVYDNNDFDSVRGLSSAESATVLNSNAGYVNCPVVYRD
jgi:hypothetical protein